MNITLRMAWRNLWRHQRRTWLTIAAMVFSNTLLVFLISLQFGSYQMMIDNTLKAYTGHLQIQQKDYFDTPRIRHSIADAIPLADRLRRQIDHAELSVRGLAFALASSEQRSYGLQIIGVDPEFEASISSLPGLIASGRYLDDMHADEIVIGSALARNLQVSIGDEITLLGSGYDGSFAAGVVRLVGIFESGIPDLDRSIAEVPLGYFQSLFNMQGRAHTITFVADSLGSVASVKQQVQQQIQALPDLRVLDWDQLEPGLKQAIQADLASAWFMYGVLIILVAFSVLNTQLMSVLERTREFGIMMALGVKPGRLSGLVLMETALMASLGLIIGIIVGFVLTWYLSIVGFSYPGMEDMAVRFNLPDRIYPSVSLLSLLLGPGVVFIGCLLAAIYPSLRLWVLNPVSAMRAV